MYKFLFKFQHLSITLTLTSRIHALFQIGFFFLLPPKLLSILHTSFNLTDILVFDLNLLKVFFKMIQKSFFGEFLYVQFGFRMCTHCHMLSNHQQYSLTSEWKVIFYEQFCL